MQTRRIYIAASFPRKDEARNLADILTKIGHRITSSWHQRDEEYDAELSRAKRDVEEIRSSDTLISFIGDNLTKGGRHTELGIAIALEQKIFLIGDKPEQVFHHLSHINICKDATECLNAIGVL